MGDEEGFRTRPYEPGDLVFLWEMLYEAAHYRSLSDPAISRYLNGWGRYGDAAVVALDPGLDPGGVGRRVGAAWYRLFPFGEGGYGFVDAVTPEVAIAVVPDRRGRGVGGLLLRALMGTAASQGFGALSLSVRRNNPAALRLYEKSGFVRLFEVGVEYPSWAMKADLSAEAPSDESPITERTEER